MNSEVQHERQRIGPAKCQRGVVEQRATSSNSISEESSVPSRLVVESRKIKKERNFVDTTSENGTSGNNGSSVTSGGEITSGNSENGHHNSRTNSVCRNTATNGFHPGEILQEIIAAKFGQTTTGNANKNDKIRLMIEDSLGEDSKSRVQEIFLQVEQLKVEEKLLLYLRLPASLANPAGTVDPLRQPLNPLGNRYEIHQTIMWIKTHLEEDPDVSLPKQEVYDEYNVFCIRNAMKPLSTADFGKVMKQVYPRVRPRRLGTRGNSRYCYAGMRKRVKLDTPTLPAITDATTTDDFEEPITEEMLGAASTLIREWAESLLKMKFSTLSALARHLVDNLRVDTRSLAAVCILCAPGDGQASSINKVSETSPSLSVTPVAGKSGKLREAQLQLQRKLQAREQTRDQKSRQSDPTLHNSVKEKIEESPTTITRSSSSIGKGCKKSKTSQSPQISVTTPVSLHSGVAMTSTTAMTTTTPTIPTTPTTATTTTTPTTGSGASSKTSQTSVTISSPASSRNRKLPRSSSQANINALSPQFACDNNLTSQMISSQRPGDEIRNNNSRSCTPIEPKIVVKNSRKRSSLELSRTPSESSPEKQAKLSQDHSNNVTIEETTKVFAKLPPIQRIVEKVTLVAPSGVKLEKPEQIEPEIKSRNAKLHDDTSIMEKMTNGRSTVWEAITVNNRLEEKLCTIDPDALDDYLNGGNNSQEQEEELLQYFQQSNSSNCDLEAGNQMINPEIDRVSRSDKVSQLRLILQQNFKAVRPNNNESGVPISNARRTTPIETKSENPTKSAHDIILPILLNHTNHVSSGTRRRVSFETSVIEQHAAQQAAHQETPGCSSSGVHTVPQSPNTRRRIFNFTPISPGPHSPINGRAASKPNSENASPFVSPRNTPVPRSRSNLQGICRSRTNQKSLARSISCSVPYTVSRNETFVVPTSNSDTRLGQNSLVCPRNVEVQAEDRLNGGGGDDRTQTRTNPSETKIMNDSGGFLAVGDLNPQKQLLINYPSQENLQEIKNVYGNCLTLGGIRGRNLPADAEISELLNGATRQQNFISDQIYYRSQSVPLHRMVNPTLMSPIGTGSQFVGNIASFNNSSSSSIAPTPVPSEFNDFVSIGAHDAYLLDDVDTGFIADDQQFLMEDKESITKILNILDEEGRQSLAILPDRNSGDDNLLENSNLTIGEMLDPLPNADLSIQNDILDPSVVLEPCDGNNLRKIIESRSYPNTPLPIVAGGTYGGAPNYTEDCSNGSRSYPTTPLHNLQAQEVYGESNEPMLSSPTLNSLNLRADNSETVAGAENVCRNVTDLLETNFLGDTEGGDDDLDPLGNFDGLQDVDSLTPLFNEVTDANR